MPTQLDRALNSKNLLLGFAGAISAAAAWSIWGGDMFPQEPDPSGNPEDWTETELRKWLRAVNNPRVVDLPIVPQLANGILDPARTPAQ